MEDSTVVDVHAGETAKSSSTIGRMSDTFRKSKTNIRALKEQFKNSLFNGSSDSESDSRSEENKRNIAWWNAGNTTLESLSWREQVKYGEGAVDRRLYKSLNDRSRPPLVIEGIKPILFHPESWPIFWWNLIVMLALLYTLTYLPYKIAFYIDDNYNGLDITVDLCFVMDIVLTFMIAHKKVKSGRLITSHRNIGRMYLKTWFIPDVIATFPYNLVYPLIFDFDSSLSRIPNILRLLRLFKLVKTYKYKQLFAALEYNPRVPLGTLRIIKLVLFVFSFAHLSACMWFFVGNMQLQFGSDSTTAITWLNRTWDDYLIAEQFRGTQYLVSSYWAFTTLTTVGYGDITPRTPLEITYTIIMMVIGATCFTYTTAAASAMVADFDRDHRIYREKMGAFATFCKRMKIPKDTEALIRKEMYSIWKNPFTTLEWDSVINSLPDRFKLKIMYELFPDVIETSKLLEEFHQYPEFLRKLIACFEPIQFNKGEYVMRTGDTVDRLIFLTEGQLIRIDRSGRTIRQYKPGATLGLEELFYVAESENAVKCEISTNGVFVLSQKLFEVINDNEAILDIFIRLAVVESETRTQHHMALPPNLFPSSSFVKPRKRGDRRSIRSADASVESSPENSPEKLTNSRTRKHFRNRSEFIGNGDSCHFSKLNDNSQLTELFNAISSLHRKFDSIVEEKCMFKVVEEDGSQ